MTRMRLAPKSKRRRAITLIILLLLAPVTLAMGLRAQGQLRNFEVARKLYLDSEQSVHQKDYPRAIEQLEEAVRLCPDLVAAWDSLGWCYFYVGQKEKAYQTMLHAGELHPDRVELPRGVAMMYALDHRYEDALASLDRAARADPTDPMVPRLRQRVERDYKRSSAP